MSKETINYILLVVITLAIAIVLSLVIRKLLSVFITKYAEKLKTDPTNFLFIKNSAGFIIYTAAIIFIFIKIPYLKSLGTALFAGAGILAVVIGVASQSALSNIISGIFILIFKPIKVSDISEFKNGLRGTVEEITLRHILIKDFENKRIVIPNSIISDETIINSHIKDEKIRKHIIFSISYDSNIDKAMDIIRDEATNHPFLIDNRTEEEVDNNTPVVILRVVSISDFSIDIKAYTWAAHISDAFVMSCDLLKSVKQRFDKEGIEIPFPHRTIVFKKDLKES
ncbi:MAG: mechanosensitive ion channel family protein [Aureibaculum sp.]|nr:mechanosensitive ion channel family protein [Aureibaculum sp.]